MFKEKVLEYVRNLRLTKKQKLDVALKYAYISEKQKADFEEAIQSYEGLVYQAFKDSLEDKYIYAYFARNAQGESMVEYLLNHNGFREKRPSSFNM